MNILIINKYSNFGGAAIASFRQYQALKQANANVKFLSQLGPDGDVVLAKSKFKQKLALAKLALTRALDYPYLKNRKDVFKFDSARLGSRIPNKIIDWADILHFHWINFGFFSLKKLEKVFSLGKPIVLTPHDQWYMTGGCFFPYDCQNFYNSCQNCPMLKFPGLAEKTFNKKMSIYNKTNLHVIAISNWIAHIVKSSPLLKNTRVTVIPNPINTQLFKPLNKQKIQKKLGLAPNKSTLGFVAYNLNDPRKGGKFLLEALKIFENSFGREFQILAIGRVKNPDVFGHFKDKIHFSGYVSSAQKMVELYNAMDVLILPSLSENLPLVILEALSCGVPAVAFNVGGIPDMIEHKKNGYLAQPQDAQDLASGILWVLENRDYQQISSFAHTKVEQNFSYPVVANRLLDLYSELLKK